MNEKKPLLLKTTLYERLHSLTKELSRLHEELEHMPMADVKVITTKISCLSQHKKDIEDIIMICVDRNKF